MQSWKRLYDRQRSILTWPVDELKADFVDEFKDLIPIETSVEFPTDPANEKETTLLSRYQRYIKNTLPDIAKIADAEWTAEFDRSMSMDSMMGMESGPFRAGRRSISRAPKRGRWSNGTPVASKPFSRICFPWRGQLPSTLEVYYSQENIWILKQLLQIIADVNGDARQPYQAKIREIKQIGIGKSVKFGEGNISRPGQRSMGNDGHDGRHGHGGHDDGHGWTWIPK